MDLIQMGKDPIRPEQPAGADIRNSPDFEALQAEMDKLTLPRLAGSMDWEKVVIRSSDILAQKSKDLLVTSFLALALIYTQKVEGLMIGLTVYRNLLENFWESLYPPKTRMRARVRAVEWWLEKTEGALKQLGEVSLSAEQIGTIEAEVGKIDEFLRRNLEEPISLHALKEFLNTLAVSSGEKPSPEEMTPGQEKAPAAAEIPTRKEPAGEAAQAIPSPQEAQRAINQSMQKIREAANFLSGNDVADPAPYRWARIAAWSIVESLPPHTDGKTRIPPPPEPARKMLSALRDKGEWPGLLKQAEEKLLQFIFWIDLNRWVAEALTALGPQHQAACDVVCQETAFLLYRFPRLENLSFSDGTPFADGGTKEWLKEIALGQRMPPGESPLLSSPGPSGGEEEMEKEVAHAQRLIKEGKMAEAIAGFQQKSRVVPSPREKLLWTLALGQLLLHHNKPRLARPYLGQIMKDLDFYHLEAWDPSLALRCLQLIFTGLNALQDPGRKEEAREILMRIAQLDPAEGIRLGLD